MRAAEVFEMKKVNRNAGMSTTAALLLLAVSMSAHHSESINDQDRIVFVTGTVTQFVFTNPHIQIHLDVKDKDGNLEKWIATAGGPSALRRDGWNSRTLQPGDEITIAGFPYKDGRNILFQLKIVRANGEALPQSDGSRGRWERFLATHPNQELDPRFK
jgi:hypothetical protein